MSFQRLFQSQDHQEHGVGEPGADGRGVEEEVWEGEGQEQESEDHHPEAGGRTQPLEERWETKTDEPSQNQTLVHCANLTGARF